MKNVNKILAVVLTVAMLAGLVMMAVPVSAGSLSWSVMTQPPVTVGTNANVYAIAADGKTIYVYTETDGGLHKSSDAGETWTDVDIDTDDDIYGMIITSIKVSQSDSSELIATDGTYVYVSTDSGKEWDEDTPDVPTGYDIMSVDISANSDDDSVYLVGVASNDGNFDGGVALYDSGWMSTWDDEESDQMGTDDGWGYDLALDSGVVGATYDVYAVGFSPDYADDNGIVAVVGNSDGVWLRTLAAQEDEDWQDDLAACVID